MAVRLPSKEEILAELDRRSYLHWYSRHIPSTYSVPPHVEFLCGVAQNLIDGKYQRVCISTPPGHTKSETISRRLAVYWGIQRAKEQILLTGYSQRFAEKNLSSPARDLAKELGVLSSTSTALDEWHFTNGSKLVARGVGNPPTGINPITLAIVDDPISSREDAASEVMRENIWSWWTGSIIQRFWPETRALVIATRWHEDDLIGRIKANDTDGKWAFINLPAIAEENDILGREVGEALWPAAKPIEFLRAQRKDMGEYEFEALFQGNPTPKEGALIKVGMLTRIARKDVPENLFQIMSTDMGSTTKGDWTSSVQTWRCPVSGRVYIDPHRCQLEPFERNVWLRNQADSHNPDKVLGQRDPGAAGKAEKENFIRLMAGFDVEVIEISGDKETRITPLAAQVNAGMVYVVDGPHTDAFIEEGRQFPNGKFDDMWDAAADGFNKHAKRPLPGQSRSRTGWRLS